MRVNDVSCRAKGMVSPSFADIRTGKRVPFSRRSNTLSYASAEAMAAAFGGDPSYIPSRIGFIYGDQMDMPIDEGIDRLQSWDRLCEQLGSVSQGATVDVQIVGFSYAPSLGPDPSDSGSSDSWSSDDSDGYNNILSGGSNAVTFHAVSNSQDIGYFGRDTFKAESYIYQCLLLGYHQGRTYILARASLKSPADGGPAYLQKPKGFEVALDWTVVFR